MLYFAYTPSYGIWYKDFFGSLAGKIDNCTPFFMRSRYIQKYYFIGTFSIIKSCKFHRVTRIFYIYKMNSFYNPALVYVQTWDYSFSYHLFEPQSLLPPLTLFYFPLHIMLSLLLHL